TDPDGIGGISATPGGPLADQEPADPGPVAPVDRVQTDEADVPSCLVEDCPGIITVILSLDPVKERLFTLPTDPEIEFDHRGDLRVVHPPQRVIEVKQSIGRDQPDPLTFPANKDFRHGDSPNETEATLPEIRVVYLPH